MAVFDADKDISPGIVVSVPFFGGILALLMIGVLMKKVRAAPRGEGPQLFIADQIAEGAVAFLKTEYTYLLPFVVICAAFIVGILEGQSGSPVDYSDNKGGWQTTVCFLSGASLSALAGWMGMKIATETNVKTMQAAKESLNSALKIAFAGGAVMGFYVVALGILGLVVLFYAFSMGQDNASEDGSTFDPDMRDAIRYLSGFGFGASSIALFARVAGGIYTKAADVGADLVGKVESDIPEDDPRNPATVADNVGDNVGDVAGMGADLFESFVGSIIACASLASSHAEIALPFWVAGFGILAATIGFWTVSTKDDADQSELLHALHRGVSAMELGRGTGLSGLSAGVMDVYECERLVEAIEAFEPKTIGTAAWIQQHCSIDRLNVQAHQCVANNTDEFVVEAFMSFDKLPVLVHELILIETFKWKAFPELQDELEGLKSSVKPYLIMYQEAVLANLIECCMFSESAAQAIGEAGLVELVDWCARKVTYLNSMTREEFDAPHRKKTAKEYAAEIGSNLSSQKAELEFQCCMTALSITRFLSEHMTKLELGVMGRIINPNDLPMQLVPLLDVNPWTHRSADGNKTFMDGKWEVLEDAEYLRLNKYQAQVWLSIYNLVMEPTMRQKYDINSYRKNVLVDLRKYFNTALIDQLPILGDLQRTIEELNMMAAPEASQQSFFMLEQVMTMREGLVKQDWDAIIEFAREITFAETEESYQEEMRHLAEWYNSFDIDSVLDDPKCAKCGQPAEKRCSRCKNEWYCSRECQVDAWEGHKFVCDIVTNDRKEFGTVDHGAFNEL